MEKSTEENPFLEEYKRWMYFNHARLDKGMSVLGRPRGPYVDLDNNFHFATGQIEGWNLELLKNDLKHLQVEPLPPRKIIKRVLFGDAGQVGILYYVEQEIHQAFDFLLRDMFKEFPKKITILKE